MFGMIYDFYFIHGTSLRKQRNEVLLHVFSSFIFFFNSKLFCFLVDIKRNFLRNEKILKNQQETNSMHYKLRNWYDMELESEAPNVISPCFCKQLELCFESWGALRQEACGCVCEYVEDPKKPFHQKLSAREMKIFWLPFCPCNKG